MGKIKNSPLIEAIFELKWGETQAGRFSYKKEETDLFPGVFSRSVGDLGYSYYEQVYPGENRPSIPYDVNHRFRKSENSWPCFQIGLGIFTVNQIGNLSLESGDSDEYDWDVFKPDILSGLTVLDGSYPSGIKNLVSPKASLRYQDGFILEDDETIESFVSNKIKAEIQIAHVFTDESNISDGCQDIKLDFTYKTTRPRGVIKISVMSARIRGRKGIVIDTAVISDLSENNLSLDFLDNWCEEAHDLHRHTFDTLIRTSDLKG